MARRNTRENENRRGLKYIVGGLVAALGIGTIFFVGRDKSKNVQKPEQTQIVKIEDYLTKQVTDTPKKLETGACVLGENTEEPWILYSTDKENTIRGTYLENEELSPIQAIGEIDEKYRLGENLYGTKDGKYLLIDVKERDAEGKLVSKILRCEIEKIPGVMEGDRKLDRLSIKNYKELFLMDLKEGARDYHFLGLYDNDSKALVANYNQEKYYSIDIETDEITEVKMPKEIEEYDTGRAILQEKLKSKLTIPVNFDYGNQDYAIGRGPRKEIYLAKFKEQGIKGRTEYQRNSNNYRGGR